MSITISGVVTNGVVVPSSPLPEGANVEIHVTASAPSVSSEMREELEGWDHASAASLELVERLAQEMEANEKR